MGFFEEYFLNPIQYGTGYNIVNTLVYGIILILGAWIVYKILNRLKIGIDRNFLLGILPFIFLGGILRALEDKLILSGFWFVTPGIYLLLFSYSFFTLLVSLYLAKNFNKDYHKMWFTFGSLPLLYTLIFFKITDFYPLILILGITGVWSVVFYPVQRYTKYLSFQNYWILLAHLFDASATFVALSFFPYFEQHVLPSFLIGLTGPWIMFPLKIAVVWPVLWLFDKEIEDNNLRNFLKIVVLILGLAPGVRDVLTLILG